MSNDDYIFILYADKYGSDAVSGYFASTRLLIYDITNDIWSERKIKLKADRYFLAGAINANSIYIFGGMYYKADRDIYDENEETAVVERCDVEEISSNDEIEIECEYAETMENARSNFRASGILLYIFYI